MGTAPTCPKCNGIMQAGFLDTPLNRDGVTRDFPTNIWVEGEPEYSWWTDAAKTGDRNKFPVRTFRCTNCGYLESYALPES